MALVPDQQQTYEKVEVQELNANRILAVMPKAELHLHLDGALRLETIADLATQQGVVLPVPADQLSDVCVVSGECRDLVELLSLFSTGNSVLQTGDALERVTYELCEDVRRENVRYVEIRFAPSLHRERGLCLHDIIAAVIRGWDAGKQAFGLTGGIILCGLRHMPPANTMEVARAGIPFLGRGVIGFDLAGDEAKYDVLLHREPLLWAREAGYRMTVHAGEAAGAESVRNAVEVIGVSRIGHGVRSEEDPAVVTLLRDRDVTLDMCPTSNVQTHAVSGLASHPLARYYHAGVGVTINTDNRTVSNTTMTRELGLSHRCLGLSLPELADITLTAVRAGFADASERETLLEEYSREMRDLGILA